MITDEMIQEYDDYLTSHINNVKLGFDWLYVNLPELFSSYDADFLGDRISHHDESKWGEEEYFAYCEYFYGEKTPEVEENFDYAWLHHQHSNPHHWQHWLLREDDGDIKALEIPYEYILELICDWWSFSWKKNDLYEIFNWYEDNKKKIILNEKTKIIVENLLKQIKDTLDKRYSENS